MSKRIILLYSGGADSVYMLLMALRMGHSVTLATFNYGQKHVAEIMAARKTVDQIVRLAEASGVVSSHMELNLSGAFQGTASNLLQGSEADYAGVHEMHVPGRNGIFLFAALSLAETQNADEVWIGCDYSDRINLFPDCYQEWIVRMDDVAQISGSRPVRIKAPLLGLEKEDVINLLAYEGVQKSDIFSGYTPTPPLTSTLKTSVEVRA